jgi:hypothetical protein
MIVRTSFDKQTECAKQGLDNLKVSERMRTASRKTVFDSVFVAGNHLHPIGRRKAGTRCAECCITLLFGEDGLLTYDEFDGT